MAEVQYTAQLDFTDNGTFETGWRIKQGDYNESILVIRVVNNGVNMYDANVTPTIAFKRADGKSVVGEMTPNDGTYTYTLVGNEIAVPGPTLVDVKYVDSEGRISTASCRFNVIEDTIGYDPTGASTYNNPVSQLVAQATEDSLIAEGFAVGQQRGQDVPSTSPYYHNNAKYYSELSDPTAFANMSDVDFDNLQNGQVPVYNSTSGKWENSSGGGGASALNDLTDVTITSASNGQVLKYDSANSKWINANESGGGASSLNDLTDVTITSASQGQVLMKGSSNWENASLSKSSVGLGNVDNTSDLNKPISTATQTALDGKASSASAGVWTNAVSGLVGDTTVTFTNANIATTSTLELFSENTSGTPIVWTAVSASSGSATYTITSLTEATDFKLWIRNI